MKIHHKNITASTLAFVACTFSWQCCLGTPQLQDALEYKQQAYPIGKWMDSLPLEDYFRAGKKRPDDLTPLGSNCWRGYIAYWRVADNRLWLTGMFRQAHEGWWGDLNEAFHARYPIAKIFGEKAATVEATWFTGKIELERKVVKRRPVARGEERTYESRVLVFEKGNLMREEKGQLVVVHVSTSDGLPPRSRLGPPPLKPIK